MLYLCKRKIMKRLSNKQRKLIYIRQKNRLRLGGSLMMYFKVSNEIMKYEDFLHEHIQDRLIEAVKKYKMLLTFDIQTGINGDDFLKNIQTVKLTFTKLKP